MVCTTRAKLCRSCFATLQELRITQFLISKMLDMELMTAADILQEATLKMAMLYETHPNDAMFSVRDYFSGDEADALVQTGMWMRQEGWLIPSKQNLYYRYLYNNNLRGIA